MKVFASSTAPREKTMDRNSPNYPQDCLRIRETLGLVGDKWTVLILAALGDQRIRFKDLHRAVGGISQRMLTVTLRALERDGLLVRIVYPEVPPRVEYELSERGRTLKAALEPIGAWIIANQDAIDESRRHFDEDKDAPGKPLVIKW